MLWRTLMIYVVVMFWNEWHVAESMSIYNICFQSSGVLHSTCRVIRPFLSMEASGLWKSLFFLSSRMQLVVYRCTGCTPWCGMRSVLNPDFGGTRWFSGPRAKGGVPPIEVWFSLVYRISARQDFFLLNRLTFLTACFKKVSCLVNMMSSL